MNELFFFLHLGVIILGTLGAFRLGKEALLLWVCLQAIFANFFVLKQINLCGFSVTCSDVFAVGGILGLNLIREFYGKSFAKKTATFCFYSMLLFSLFSQIHLLYLPTAEDTMHEAYTMLLKPSPRLFLASLLVFFIVQKIDIKIFTHLKNRENPSPFTIRNLLSLLLSQLLDTILFTFLGLYGVLSSLVDIIFISFLIKSVAILCLTPLTWFIQKKHLTSTHHP